MPQPLDISDFGYGLMTKLSPTQQPHGAALVSFDCTYNTRNIQNRNGYASVLENGPGAVKVADFESGEAWSGGSADTVNFVVVEAAADGLRGRQLSAVGGAGETVATLTVALDMGTDPLDVIHTWIKTLALPAGITAYTLTLRFQTSGGNHFQATISSQSDLKNKLELNLSKYHRFRRQDFAQTGTPVWTNITQIRFGLTATGTGTLTIAVDNLHRTPGLMQDLFQFRRETGVGTGASSFYAVAGGSLYKNDGKRWVSVFSGFNAGKIVNSISAQNMRLMTDGVTSPRVLLADGSTVYRLGIVTPTKTMTAAQLDGVGGLPDGQYFAQMLFFSSKTGTFSAPDDRTPLTPIVTISGGANVAGIRFSNIPVSTDPQVDWVVIGIRPATEPSLFFRASDGLFGEVPNGTTTFDFTDNLATLLARSLTAIDPDLDYPSVIDPSSGQPVEAHPLFFAEAGGYILSVMSEAPTVVRVSRFRQPGSWQLDDEFPLGENDQEGITGIAVSASRILVMKRDAVFPGRVVGGDERVDFDDRISDRGATSHKGMAVAGHSLFYRAMDGVYRIGKDMIPRKVSDLAQPTWKSIWDPFGIGSEVTVPVRNTEQVIIFGKSLGALRNDIGWVTHYRTVDVELGDKRGRLPGWAPTIWRMPADTACVIATQGNDGGGWETWIGGLGQVFRIDYGQEDDQRPINMIHRTALISPNPILAHVFRFLDIEAQCSGEFNMTAAVYLGTAINTDGSPMAFLKGNAVVLGTFVLGSSFLGAPQYISQRLNLPPRAVRYISVDISITARADVQVYRLRPWSSPLGARRSAA